MGVIVREVDGTGDDGVSVGCLLLYGIDALGDPVFHGAGALCGLAPE